jgi:tetratricopeptide (TPR) repeat protein
MKTVRALAAGFLLTAGGCLPDHPPVPEEVAVDRFEAGEKMYAEGKFAEAAVEFEYALKYRPRWKAAYVRLADCDEKTKHETDAIDVFERLLRIDRTDEDALRGLGRLYAGRGEPARALECWRRLKVLRPDDRSIDGEIARLEAMRKP